MPRSREERIATRTRNAKWKNAPLRIDMTDEPFMTKLAERFAGDKG